jgi:aldehyde dehydrogenase (NAD+)
MVISVSDIIQKQRQFFATGKTKDVDFRIEQLKNLKSAIASNQSRIVDAVKADLNRPEYEAYFEIAAIADS